MRVFNAFKALLLVGFTTHALAAEIQITRDLAYRVDAEGLERCKLDIYQRNDAKDSPCLVWFHGGGLTGGGKEHAAVSKLGSSLAGEGLCVVLVNYRLSPQVKFPAYVEDAAAAVAWTQAHIARHGGNPQRIFVGGHSAGGYLALLLGMDERYLTKHGSSAKSLAGLIPVSAQVMTHNTVRGEKYGSDDPFRIVVDDAAPVFYAKTAKIPPMLVIWADRDAPARAEENAYFVAVMRGAGHEAVKSLQVENRDHSSIAEEIANPNDPARKAMLEMILGKQP